MSDERGLVLIIDDDPVVRSSLVDLLSSVGIGSVELGSVTEYLAGPRPDQPSCLILDISLPDMSGLEFQARMHSEDHPPIVFLTGLADIPSSVTAMKRGAVDYLLKPITQDTLLRAVRAAIELDQQRLLDRAELLSLRSRLEGLSPREREVLPLVVGGLMNKQAAAELGISEYTFQIHRSKVMQKMNASTLADLVRMATTLGVSITHSRFPGARIQ